MIHTLINEANLKRQTALNKYFDFIIPQIFKAGRDEAIQKEILGKYLLEIAKVKYTWEQLPNRTNAKIMQENLVLPIMKLDNNYKASLDIVITSSQILLPASEAYAELGRLIDSYKQLFYREAQSFRYYVKIMKIAIIWLK